ncbi:hypothetical protein GCM10023093_30720 [Nemorincola caseinilytica]|uniref:Uncharacterized protein n=1 Tax=Nemorincola caseinilytica TaxID=2054315 RepID=A0ABP8NRY8_9BACT
MRPIIYTLCFLVCSVGHMAAQAGSQPDTANKLRREIGIGFGLLSLDQVRGITMEAGLYSSRKDLPVRMTGALFLTYRHYLSGMFAVAVCVGMDNQVGYLNAENGTRLGSYKREVYTAAAEFFWVYEQDLDEPWPATVYGLAGIGYTGGHSYFGYYPQFSNNYTIPYNARISHFNVQVTPVAVRFGRRIGVFFELGYGYKGLVCGGISYFPGRGSIIAVEEK